VLGTVWPIWLPRRGIAHHIDLTSSFTAGFDYEGFVADPRTVVP